ncbi:DUF268 domain-containing protein [Candidatus Parcubacteria bacterium]|nr:DUF268 domain-containing protein [Candidatus Parcubacteria bacterium]
MTKKIKVKNSIIKKPILLISKILLKILQIISQIIKKISIFLITVNNYLKQNECEKYKDCVLLNKLKSRQPPCADRNLEYPWMIKNINITKGELLDVGSTACDLLYELLPETIEINGINLNKQTAKNNKIKLSQGDIRNTGYQNDYFDCITCISTLEHIGVSGRYNSDNDHDGDIKAMQEMKRILKPGGILLVTVPYGTKDVLPINKLYNKNRIEKLFNGYDIVEQKFSKFNQKFNLWLETREEEAAKTNMLKDRWYAIAFIKAKKNIT